MGSIADRWRGGERATRRTALRSALALGIAAICGACAPRAEPEDALNWPDTKELVRSTFPEAPQLSVGELARRLQTTTEDERPVLIDVRDAEEYAVSHLPGAVHAQGRAVETLVRDAGPARDVVLYCSVGYRSSKAAQRLQRKGHGNVQNLEGSIFEWANDGHPVVRGAPGSETPTDAVHPFDDEWGALLHEELRSYDPRPLE